MIGTTLSHFRITAKLGEGGMGEVYRAEDTKLGREVAIKVLPRAVAQDPERLARFEREAKVLASLNHPHVAAIYSIESAGVEGAPDDPAQPVHFLVMELVEGEDLKERIARGPIPLAQALPIALQIAGALEAAHEQGIVHRDLKPANVKVGRDGTVKVLDFGLAKALETGTGPDQDPSRSPLSLSPTLTAQMTQAGVLLGTAAYMSPEQARGQEADKRADIWSFGVVLLEMLTGQTTFPGDTVSDTLAGILAREPEWDSLPATTPHAIRALLERCLEKNAIDRLRDIGDARIEIKRYLARPEADEVTAVGEVATTAARRPGWRRALPWALLTLTAALLAYALWRMSALPPEGHSLQATVLPPEGTTVELNPFHPGPTAISPDGTRLAVTALGEDGAARLYVRSLDSMQARLLPGTDGAGYPFWSPDSRWIAYFSQIDGTLKKIDSAGGPPIRLCEAGNGKGGSWNANGAIVFAPESDSVLYRVSDAGGERTPLTELDTTRFNSHRHPRFLPDGRHFLYLARANPAENSAVMIGDLEDGSSRELMRSRTQAEYASGFLLFARDTTLMAQPFDPRALELRGEARPIVERTLEIEGAAIAVFSASDNGVIAYHTGSMSRGLQLEWRDREGGRLGDLGNERADYEMISMSPDGETAAVVTYDAAGTADLQLFEIATGLHSRFTFDPGNELWPVWSPDGGSLVFAARRDGDFEDIYRKALGGVGETELLFASQTNKVPSSLSPDGRWLLFDQWSSDTKNDIWAWSVESGGEPIAFVQTAANERGGVFSPNGRWVAYHASESGLEEVYVTPFPGPGRKWQVSTEGGLYPQWRADGQELFYVQADGLLVAVEVRTDTDSFRVGQVQPLFRVGPPRSFGPGFAPTPDGQRLLVSQILGRQADTVLNLVVNWPAELEDR